MLHVKKIIAVLGVAGALLLGAGPAAAQVDTYEETPPPVDVGGEGVVPGDPSGEELGTDVLGDTVTRSGSSTLPVTGGDLVGLAGIGAAAIAAGTGTLLYRRRQLS